MATIASPMPSGVPLPNRALITASVILATVLQVLDTTIANVALPHMQAALGANRETITWVRTSYIVAAAIATPIFRLHRRAGDWSRRCWTGRSTARR